MASDRHNDLARRCLVWLGNKSSRAGFKGSTEVSLGDGLVFDAAALCWFQGRFWDQYFGREHRWNDGKIPVCIFESKVSRSDFVKTFVKDGHIGSRLKPFGHLHWLVADKDVCKESELPDWWGLLNPSGAGLKEIRRPKPTECIDGNKELLEHELLWRGDLNIWNTTGEYIRGLKRQMVSLVEMLLEKHPFDSDLLSLQKSMREEMGDLSYQAFHCIEEFISKEASCSKS